MEWSKKEFSLHLKRQPPMYEVLFRQTLCLWAREGNLCILLPSLRLLGPLCFMRESTSRLPFCFLSTLPFALQLVEISPRFCSRLFLSFSVNYFHLFLSLHWFFLKPSVLFLASSHASRIHSFFLHRLYSVYIFSIKLFSFQSHFLWWLISWRLEHSRTDMIKRVAEVQ